MFGSIGVRSRMASRRVTEEAARVTPAGPPSGAACGRGAGPAVQTSEYHALALAPEQCLRIENCNARGRDYSSEAKPAPVRWSERENTH